MRFYTRTGFLGVMLLAAATVVLRSAPQTAQTPPPPAQPASQTQTKTPPQTQVPVPLTPPVTPVVSNDAPGQDHFAGIWDYNADDSVDAATGRKEQGPRSATQRRGGLPGAARPAPNPNNPFAGGGYGGGGYCTGGFGGYGGGGGGGGMPGLGLVYINPLRDLVRDLMEVPEALRIQVSEQSVTFTDDLDRERTYPTNNRKQKYQLGAAVFEAKVRWDGPQLKKEIEGDEIFKMQETYFLSDNGNRLFVIIRMGDPLRREKNAPVSGVNRVYDRVQQH